jgi:hypothetical protein
MKATIDIPDDLYRQVKAKSALRGQAVREVAVSLFQGWIAATDEVTLAGPAREGEPPLPAWFGAARTYAQRVRHHDLASVRRSVAQGRVGKGSIDTEEREAQ